MTIDAVGLGVHRLVLGTSLQEWFENAVGVTEVIVNNVHQETSFHKLVNQLP